MVDVEADDWEYEYDQESYETFLLDIDLTTVNTNFKPSTLNRNKRLLDVSADTTKSAKKSKTKTNTTITAATASNPTADVSEEPLRSSVQEETTRSLPSSSTDNEDQASKGFQIQGLHTENPLISYNGQIFSCTWSDLIGTSMFFSEPRETWLYDPEISTDAFDLIGLSRIRLVGKEVKVTPLAPESRNRITGNLSSKELGFSLGTIRRTNVKLNSDLRKQASFLEQLMAIKKNRGERDNVHVVMNDEISQSMTKGELKDQMSLNEREINHLNKMVVKGDAAAMKKLERIYSAGVKRNAENRLTEQQHDSRASQENVLSQSVPTLPFTPGNDHV